MQGLVTEEALRQLFNSTMKAAFPEQQIPGADPVVSVSMHSEGRYAFVELRTPDMASAALQLSGQVQLLGQSISVGRPSGYVDPSAAQMAAAQAATALQAFEVLLLSVRTVLPVSLFANIRYDLAFPVVPLETNRPSKRTHIFHCEHLTKTCVILDLLRVVLVLPLTNASLITGRAPGPNRSNRCYE